MAAQSNGKYLVRWRAGGPWFSMTLSWPVTPEGLDDAQKFMEGRKAIAISQTEYAVFRFRWEGTRRVYEKVER